ncbi:MAG: glycosyltransferase family 4 protein [Myxococcales bacterium]
MAQPRKVLFIEHAASLGGAVRSLLYSMQSLDRRRYVPLVACAGGGMLVTDFYRQQGFEAFSCPDIGLLPHTTGGWFSLRSPRATARFTMIAARIAVGIQATKQVVEKVKPDLVHLNSVVLIPSAIGLAQARVPFVWHVRESVVAGHLGLRRALIRKMLMELPDEVIFISADERRRLLDDARGIVIPDFVDLARFDRSIDGLEFRARLGLSHDAQVVLILGGLLRIKGGTVLLEAMSRLHQRFPKAHLVMASGIAPMSTRLDARIGRIVLPLLGHPTDRQRAMRIIQRHRMEPYVHLLPYTEEVEKLIAASDVVVFPSIEPHNARPVPEAGAMGKPVVGSRIGGVEELVEDNVTGILTPPGDVEALAGALSRILGDPALARQMGEAGYRRASQQYSAGLNTRRMLEVYDRLTA